ncbi:MAG: exodeoxyribonuclease VII small subunit [Planctomycetes bacterium]|nr:exodeoxyribonuclease VII small subunit [Planctomycetota bacterium]
MAKKKSMPLDASESSFEESLNELEAIVTDLEGGKLGLSEALARYEQGVRHLKDCQQLLEQAERKIEILSGMDADGNPITEPYDDRELESLETRAARSRRRTAAPSPTEQPPADDDDIDDAPRLF